jgi:hypothetical protein
MDFLQGRAGRVFPSVSRLLKRGAKHVNIEAMIPDEALF